MDINKTLENLSKKKLDNLTSLYGIINDTNYGKQLSSLS